MKISLLSLRSFSVVGSLFLLSASNYIHTMENDDTYKKIHTMQIPGAITLAANRFGGIAVGAALKAVKLYDSRGTFKSNTSYCGDGGIVIDDKYHLYQVSRRGIFSSSHLRPPHASNLRKEDACVGRPIHSIAITEGNVFFGTDDATVRVWDSLEEKITHSYTGTRTGQVIALEVTKKAVALGCSDGHFASIDREKDTEIWSYNHDTHPADRIPLRALVKSNSLCYAGYRDGEIVIADPDKMIHDRLALTKNIYALAMLQSGYLAVGHDGGIGLYDIRKNRYPLIELFLENKNNRVIALQETLGGFVSMAEDGTVDVWQEEVEQK